MGSFSMYTILYYTTLRTTTRDQRGHTEWQPRDPQRLYPAHQHSSHTGSTKAEAPSDLRKPN